MSDSNTLSITLPGRYPIQPLWWPDERHSYLLGLLVWVLVILMIVPEGFDYSELSHPGSPVSRMLWLAMGSCGLCLAIWRGKLAWLLLRWINPYLLVFAALAALSTVWSIEPATTVKRVIRFYTIVLVAIAFVLTGWHRQRFQNVLRPVITLMLAASLLLGLLFPQLAIHQSDSAELRNAWHGLAMQKNGLGALACMGVVFWFHAWLVQEVRSLRALLGIAVSLACLLLSRSSTALMAAVFVMLFLLLLLRSPGNMRRYMPYLVTLFVAVLLIYSIAILRLIPSLEFLLRPIGVLTGKDLTFSNRSEIWAIMTEHIDLSPWLGSGYGAYWIGPVEYSPSYEFVRRLYFYPNSAHNGYLEVVNDLGFVGLLCLIGFLVIYVRQSLQLLHSDRGQAALYLGLFLEQGIANLSETHWLSVVSVDFVFMTLAAVALGRAHLEDRLRQYFGQPFEPPG